ncbi:PadR family transcriptional regulator [Acrocarpospora catenulata]|uniref:PadR family transcriptional regulator n=1 Tax=Acrocarpospora catenulata TaxID=2836182 RepID=UPI002023AAB0|nr:PadR family transcriptional regulator [Acrocarpospora catenulata]
MSPNQRITVQTQAVLRVFLTDPTRQWYGLEISDTTEPPLATGTIYPILARLEGLGWVTSTWEPAGTDHGRPPRRYYTLTGEGATQAPAAIAATYHSRRQRLPAWLTPHLDPA